MAQTNYLSRNLSRHYMSTTFTISGPDYLAKSDAFRQRMQNRMLDQLLIYATKLGEAALKFYSTWVTKRGTVTPSAYRRNRQRQLVGRTAFTNPLFGFIEWSTAPHMPPLLRGKDYGVDKPKPRKRRKGLWGGKRTPGALTDARIEGTNTLSKTPKAPRPPVERIANSGITRWSNDRGISPWYVQKLISIRGTTGKLKVTAEQERLRAELEIVLVGQIMDVLSGIN
jgi:hypothetical protein